MKTLEVKNRIQEEAIETWIKTGCAGTICLFVGAGKTKVGVDAIKLFKNSKVLIVVPTTNLKENEWPNEIKRWGNPEAEIEIEVINTASKIEKKFYDLIIIDEIHKTLSPEFSKVHDIPCHYKLGLTATPPTHNKEYMEILDKVCPIIYTKTLEWGIRNGVASPFKIYNIPVDFTKEESRKYYLFNNKFNSSRAILNSIIKETKEAPSAFEAANMFRVKKDHIGYRAAKDFWSAMTLRKWVCYNAESKIGKVLGIIRNYPDKKWIVFSKSIQTVEKTTATLKKNLIRTAAYHSKMKKKDREEIIEAYRNNKIDVIVSAEALIQGLNIPQIDGAICMAGTSVELTLIQMLGRICRIQENKQALFINLFIPNTQEEVWIRGKTRRIDSTDISNIYQIEW